MYHRREERHLCLRPASHTPKWWDVPEGANRRPQGGGVTPASSPAPGLWRIVTEGANAPFGRSGSPRWVAVEHSGRCHCVPVGGVSSSSPVAARSPPRFPVRHVRLPPRPPVCVPNLKPLGPLLAGWERVRGSRAWLRTPLGEAARPRVGGVGKLAVSSVGVGGGSA